MKQDLLAAGLQTAGSAGGLPFKRLAFVPAQHADAHSARPSINLIPLNEEHAALQDAMAPAHPRKGQSAGIKEFCRESSMRLKWSTVRKAGAGLINLGNTCFMNSVLQCLTHTPPLAELCLGDRDLSPDATSGLDPIRIMQAQIRRAFSGSGGAVRPAHHAKSLKAINRRFRLGRQEDAHEYLRCLLDAMHEAYLKPLQPKPAPALAYTTFVHRIFGGRLRSQIVCEGVDYSSSTFEHYLDLSLEINRASTLQRALQHFTAPEVLDGDNRYRCPKNNKLVRAKKRMTIEEAPNVLTIQLKRFEFGGRGSKISKRVEFGMELDLAPFMSDHPRCGQQLYDLFAVLVHHGHSLHSGHYICYVKAPNGIWHLCDDHRVAQVSQRTVEGQQAYILFYIRRHPRSGAGARTPPAAAPATIAAPRTSAAADSDSKSKVASVQLSGDVARQQKAASVRSERAAEAARLAERARSHEGTGPSGKSVAGLGSAASAGPTIASHIITSSTESTANATATPSPVGQPANGDTSTLQAFHAAANGGASAEPGSPHLNGHHPHHHKPHHHHHPQHHHTHYLRARPSMGLSSWDRHRMLFASLCRTKKRRLGNSSASDRSAGAAAGAAAGDGVTSPASAGAVGAVGTKQHAAPNGGQPVPAVANGNGVVDGDGTAADAQPRKRRKQEQQGGVGPLGADAAAAERQQEAHASVSLAGSNDGHMHRHKRRHKEDEQQQQQQEGVVHAQAPQSMHSAPLTEPQPATTAAKVQPPTSRPSIQPATTAKPAAAEPLGAADAATAVTGAAALQALAQQAGTSQYGVQLHAWGDADAGIAATAAKLQRASAPKRAANDDWDEEYDRGKLKKVRKAKGLEGEEGGAGGSVFQRAWDDELPAKARAEATRQGRGMGHGRGGRGAARVGRLGALGAGVAGAAARVAGAMGLQAGVAAAGAVAGEGGMVVVVGAVVGAAASCVARLPVVLFVVTAQQSHAAAPHASMASQQHHH